MSNVVGAKDFFARYGTRLFGALCGLAAGILILTIGFWKTLLLFALMAVGWFIGSRMDGQWAARMKNVLLRALRDTGEE